MKEENKTTTWGATKVFLAELKRKRKRNSFFSVFEKNSLERRKNNFARYLARVKRKRIDSFFQSKTFF